MRIVITGGSGNVGTALLRRLHGGGHELVAVSRRRPPDTDPYRGVEWIEADLATEDALPALTRACDGADAVVHTAWLIQPSHDRELMRRTNQHGTRAVAQAAVAAQVSHLVHLSSIGAYSPGPTSTPVTEDWATNGVPTSAYSVDKAAAERILDEFEPALTITRLRPSLILQADAAGEVARYFLGPLVPTRLLRRPVLRFAPWPRTLSVQFVHADDVAAAIDTLLARRVRGAFNVAAEPPIDRAVFADLFGGVGPPAAPKLLRVVAALTWRLRLQPTEPGWLDLAMTLPLLDTTRLRELGWSPEHPGTEVLTGFVAALAHGEGGRGPLLYPERA
ncbi:MAG TPA: NAD-dependent epimerase/dehydratase family protein [Jatrophihabitans sp.]|nr:NAD-dependent epimerase/dehydratase family protein [Jatrophihabitans sp.]